MKEPSALTNSPLEGCFLNDPLVRIVRTYAETLRRRTA